MIHNGHDFVSPDQLRVGLYVELELGWMAHPFPKSSFKLTTQRQIDTIRGLGLSRVRYVPAKSDPEPSGAGAADQEHDAPSGLGDVPEASGPQALSPEALESQRRAALLAAQKASLALCDRLFGEAIERYRGVVHLVGSQPVDAAFHCRQMVDGLVADVLGQTESSIRLLSEGMGDRAFMHPVNVTVLSLLLGKALQCQEQELHDLGTAAFLHDLGKMQLPERVRWTDAHLTPAEYKSYQDHVALGVRMAQQLEVSAGALCAIAQHHELMDGSGFPRQSQGDAVRLASRVLSLVNRYDNMCNPARPAAAITPHEALSVLFTQMKAGFDVRVLNAFIRMMGVYPPGSVVELSDGRFAMVTSVNSARPLKPRVLVHDPDTPREDALVVDLEQPQAPGIRRSIKPGALPKAAMDYLSPRMRICYFFERAVDPQRLEASV